MTTIIVICCNCTSKVTCKKSRVSTLRDDPCSYNLSANYFQFMIATRGSITNLCINKETCSIRKLWSLLLTSMTLLKPASAIQSNPRLAAITYRMKSLDSSSDILQPKSLCCTSTTKHSHMQPFLCHGIRALSRFCRKKGIWLILAIIGHYNLSTAIAKSSHDYSIAES